MPGQGLSVLTVRVRHVEAESLRTGTEASSSTIRHGNVRLASGSTQAGETGHKSTDATTSGGSLRGRQCGPALHFLKRLLLTVGGIRELHLGRATVRAL